MKVKVMGSNPGYLLESVLFSLYVFKWAVSNILLFISFFVCLFDLLIYFSFFYVSFVYFFFHQGRVEMKWLPLPAHQQLFPNRIHKIQAWWATFTAKTWRLLREALVASSTEQKREWQAYELCHAPFRHSLMFRMHSFVPNFCRNVDLSSMMS